MSLLAGPYSVLLQTLECSELDLHMSVSNAIQPQLAAVGAASSCVCTMIGGQRTRFQKLLCGCYNLREFVDRRPKLFLQVADAVWASAGYGVRH
jgi:hypothetical protein